MSHLIAISIGPVQEFIAAARRTRDLWFGSYVLSELSRAAADCVRGLGGELIFPASTGTSGIANVILAELSEHDPADVARQAKEAVRRKWKEFCDDALNAVSACIRKEIWDSQADDVIEFYAAWVVRSDNYARDRARLMRLLAGRKNCREFAPAEGLAGVPKSSLDGRRESVLKDLRLERVPEKQRRLLRLREGEQLDVVGVVKRAASGNKPYPSVSRVAADPWVRGNQDKPAFRELLTACESFTGDVLHRLDPKEFPQYRSFPFEGSVVYRSRFHELQQETGINDSQSAETEAILEKLVAALEKLPEPEPYVAVLAADGDRMGNVIASLDSPNAHRRFSESLAAFADQARRIVAEHYGFLIYAGGDDVLAVVPVDQCLACAAALRDSFLACLEGYAGASLSVGIAVAHFLENLEDLLEYGRAAEKAAKMPDRNGLAIHLYKRSGAPIGIRARWDEQPRARLERLVQLFVMDVLPSRVPYELRLTADLYENWPEAIAASALRADVRRILERKQSRQGPGAVHANLAELSAALQNATDLRQLAETMLVARHLARAWQQAASVSPKAVYQEVHE
ncbi:type III-B CRISPR-associated protein Cas10/Cmr2 [Thermopirellula anaerolimosa]